MPPIPRKDEGAVAALIQLTTYNTIDRWTPPFIATQSAMEYRWNGIPNAQREMTAGPQNLK